MSGWSRLMNASEAFATAILQSPKPYSTTQQSWTPSALLNNTTVTQQFTRHHGYQPLTTTTLGSSHRSYNLCLQQYAECLPQPSTTTTSPPRLHIPLH
eukprot:6464543-Amphidinium_carterae.2